MPNGDGSTFADSCVCMTFIRTQRNYRKKIHYGRWLQFWMSCGRTHRDVGCQGSAWQLTSKPLASRVHMDLHYEFLTRGRGMVTNVMLSVKMDTHLFFTSAMVIPLLSQPSSRTVTYHRQPSVSSGLLFVFRIFGLGFTWITFSTPASYSQHSTVQNVWRMELCEQPVVAFLPQ